MNWTFWKRSKRTLATSGLLRDLTDCHSHLLPGVDDGVRSLDESLQILADMESAGIRKVWLTPHVMEDMPNTTERLRERFARLQDAYTGPVRLALAAEYMLDNLFAARLEADDVLPLIEERTYLLVETSCFNPPMGFHALLERIRSRGYVPLLAHPERYRYLSLADCRALKDSGTALQVNLPSLAGAYGPEAQKKAEVLLKSGLADLTGNDTHRLSAFRQALQAPVHWRS